MRHGLLFFVAAGCGFQADPVPDMPSVQGMWSFTAAEFGAPGHSAVAMTIEPRGALTPDSYIYGGLVAHSLVNNKLWMHGDVAWAKLDTAVATGAGLWRGDDLDPGGELKYLGVATPRAMLTLWFEGEVWLEAGSNERFDLHADDIGFIDLGAPGSAEFTPLMETGTKSFIPDKTGWYPIRLGYAVGDGTGEFSFHHADSAGAALTTWTRERLRARTSVIEGAMRTVFGRQILGGGLAPSQLPVSYFDQRDLLKASDFDHAPQGAGAEDWSERFNAQLYASEPGDYTVEVISDDGNRVRLDSVVHEIVWGRDQGIGNDPPPTTVTANLLPGWHDLVIDHNQALRLTSLQVALQSPGAAGPVPIPRALLRPLEPADDRLAVAGDDTVRSINEDGGMGTATTTLKIAAPPDETVTAIDVTYEIESQHWSQLRVDLEAPPTGGEVNRHMIRDQDPRDGPPDLRIEQLTILAGGALSQLVGGPSNGDWKLHVVDVSAERNTTSLRSMKLTLHTTGGLERIAKTASWTSAVLDAGTAVRAIDAVTWDERLPAGATLTVTLRTCQMQDCSDEPQWSKVTQGTPSSVDRARYVQVRVEMMSDGIHEPALSNLAILYHRDPG